MSTLGRATLGTVIPAMSLWEVLYRFYLVMEEPNNCDVSSWNREQRMAMPRTVSRFRPLRQGRAGRAGLGVARSTTPAPTGDITHRILPEKRNRSLRTGT
jgi:hypothetical protein